MSFNKRNRSQQSAFKKFFQQFFSHRLENHLTIVLEATSRHFTPAVLGVKVSLFWQFVKNPPIYHYFAKTAIYQAWDYLMPREEFKLVQYFFLKHSFCQTCLFLYVSYLFTSYFISYFPFLRFSFTLFYTPFPMYEHEVGAYFSRYQLRKFYKNRLQ